MLRSIRRENFTIIGHLTAGFVYASGIFKGGEGGEVELSLDWSTLSLWPKCREDTQVCHSADVKTLYYMACVCRRYNACSYCPIVGHYSPVMPTGRLRARKTKAKSHIINNLLTSNVRSLRENLKPRPSRIDLAIARSDTARSRFSSRLISS